MRTGWPSISGCGTFASSSSTAYTFSPYVQKDVNYGAGFAFNAATGATTEAAGTTTSLAYLIYRDGFSDSRMGLASATSVLLFIIIFIVTLLQRRIVRERADV